MLVMTVLRANAVSPILAVLLGLGAACRDPAPAPGYTVVRTLPHDPEAYTQGLVYDRGVLFESTGLYGQSQLRRVELESGRVLASVALPDQRFGEGLALLGDRLYQLTWQGEVGYVHEASTLVRVDSFAYQGEGWGLTTDGTSLIMSDGTATLRFLDPAGFGTVREVTVTLDGFSFSQINELEFVEGEILANVYQSTWIVRIDPATGVIRDWLVLAELVPRTKRGSATDVLNGIAYDREGRRLFVTGKRWPVLYELRLAR